LHDIERRNVENKPHGPQGAKVIGRLASRGFIDVCHCKELDTVKFVVALHEINYEQAEQIRVSDKNEITPIDDVINLMLSKPISEIEFSQITCTKQQKVVLKAIIIADKIAEAKGPRVAERRAYFVSGERLWKGDLKHLVAYNHPVFGPNAAMESSAFAFLGETLIRWAIRNPISSYPKELQPFVSKLQSSVEEEVFFNLVAELGYRFGDLVNLVEDIEKMNFPKFDADKIQTILFDLEVKYRKLSYGGKVDFMSDTPNDAFSLVSYYSLAVFYYGLTDEGRSQFDLEAILNSISFQNKLSEFYRVISETDAANCLQNSTTMDHITFSKYFEEAIKSEKGKEWVRKIKAYREGGKEFLNEFEAALVEAFPPKD